MAEAEGRQIQRRNDHEENWSLGYNFKGCSDFPLFRGEGVGLTQALEKSSA